ncbi:MAG: hypothetical protein LBC20_16225, partial [Planctomycetaceae bacterium]|nr:hypothetical protein [Planctomycetaceae bacterium]
MLSRIKLTLVLNRITFYLPCCHGKRITVISKKPYKIRSLKMENFMKCLVVFLGTFLAKIPL